MRQPAYRQRAQSWACTNKFASLMIALAIVCALLSTGLSLIAHDTVSAFFVGLLSGLWLDMTVAIISSKPSRNYQQGEANV